MKPVIGLWFFKRQCFRYVSIPHATFYWLEERECDMSCGEKRRSTIQTWYKTEKTVCPMKSRALSRPDMIRSSSASGVGQTMAPSLFASNTELHQCVVRDVESWRCFSAMRAVGSAVVVIVPFRKPVRDNFPWSAKWRLEELEAIG